MSEYHSTVYALTLLSEYTHTLDSLPIDLSRNFADLRELDAVLSSSIHSITAKIYRLISMIEDDTATNADRLWLLSDIAAEAQRLKVGGEDKIRVACQGADNLKAHAGHLRALTEHIPGFDASVLDRKTTYPHVSDRAYMPTFIMETGRRRRGGLGSIMVATNPEPSPVKRKRVAKEDDVDVTGRSPKKPIQAESSARVRSNGRKKCAYFRFEFESVYFNNFFNPQERARAISVRVLSLSSSPFTSPNYALHIWSSWHQLQQQNQRCQWRLSVQQT